MEAYTNENSCELNLEWLVFYLGYFLCSLLFLWFRVDKLELNHFVYTEKLNFIKRNNVKFIYLGKCLNVFLIKLFKSINIRTNEMYC